CLRGPLLSVRPLGQDKPGEQGGKLFVHPPGWAELSAHFFNPFANLVHRPPELLGAPIKKLPLLHWDDWQSPVLRGLDERISKQLTFRGVNCRVRCKRLSERSERPAGCKKHANAGDGETSRLQFSDEGAELLSGKALHGFLAMPDKLFGCLQV